MVEIISSARIDSPIMDGRPTNSTIRKLCFSEFEKFFSLLDAKSFDKCGSRTVDRAIANIPKGSCINLCER